MTELFLAVSAGITGGFGASVLMVRAIRFHERRLWKAEDRLSPGAYQRAVANGWILGEGPNRPEPTSRIAELITQVYVGFGPRKTRPPNAPLQLQ